MPNDQAGDPRPWDGVPMDDEGPPWDSAVPEGALTDPEQEGHFDGASKLTLYDHEHELAEAFADAQENPEDDPGCKELVRIYCGVVEKRERVVQFLQHLKAQEDFAEVEIDRLKQRKQVIHNGRKRLQGYVVHVMQELGVRKLESKTSVMSLRKSPDSVVITDESLIPSRFLLIPPRPVPKPIKGKIKNALKAGEEVPGADLVYGGDTLAVR